MICLFDNFLAFLNNSLILDWLNNCKESLEIVALEVLNYIHLKKGFFLEKIKIIFSNNFPMINFVYSNKFILIWVWFFLKSIEIFFNNADFHFADYWKRKFISEKKSKSRLFISHFWIFISVHFVLHFTPRGKGKHFPIIQNIVTVRINGWRHICTL